MTKRPKFLAVVLLLAGCNDYSRNQPPSLDEFRYPVGLALRHVPSTGCTSWPCTCVGGTAGCRTLLYVTSSNFDLYYDPATGGTVMALDPDAIPQPGQRLPHVGSAVRMGSFSGRLAVVDETTCRGWEDGTRPPLALVASRSQRKLHTIEIDKADGGIYPKDSHGGCGPLCEVPLGNALGDPWDITVTCRRLPGGALEPTAWLSYLSTPGALAYVSEIPLEWPLPGNLKGTALDPSLRPCRFAVDPVTGTGCAPVSLGAAVVSASTWDPVGQRLFATFRFYTGGFTPVRYRTLSFFEDIPPDIRLDQAVSGSEATGIAISSDGSRAYVGVRLYSNSQAIYGRPPDLGGALAVLDLTPASRGGVSGALLRLVPLPLGPAEVRLIRRGTCSSSGDDCSRDLDCPGAAGGETCAPSMPDLVAVTCTLDSSVHIYDAGAGRVVKSIGADPGSGKPILGRQAFGLAVESPWRAAPAPAPSGLRLFVASFDQSFVSVVEIDDRAHPEAARVSRVIQEPQ